VRTGISIDESDPVRAAAQPQWWVHRKWIEELHQLRGQSVHQGHVQTSAEWGWTAFEHLLMSAHAFPLTVKALLLRDGHYALTEDDETRCLAIDPILASTAWYEQIDHTPRWQSIFAERSITHSGGGELARQSRPL